MSRFSLLKKYLPLAEAVSIYRKIKSKKQEGFKVSRLRHPFSMRNNAYDFATFEEVILRETYNVQIDFTPRYIIDGGGNIGLTAAYFATRFPEASIITLEPDRENFSLLQKNTSLYKNIIPVNSGLWWRSADLIVKDTGLGNNGFVVEEVEKNTVGSVPALSIADIMLQQGWNHIDLVKLDVEGSEKEIFSSGYQNWLPKTRVLIVEVHDRMKKGCSKSLLNAVNSFNFSLEIAGENLVFRNEELPS
ncbi:MAG TPA: FkbM family methyltransferase [Flavisolibacter sp.]|nr:FkbM family methyltransferase [Flavisolibacter sp.]